MKRFLGALFLSGALLTPAALRADKDDHDRDNAHRYYDRDAKDWHEWNEHEDRAYREYLKERREQYRDWSKANRRQQQEYWRWRHDHPDSMLFHADRDNDREHHRDRDDRH